MTEQGKKNIDVLIPLFLAFAAGYWYFKTQGTKKWQGLLITILAVYLAAYIATTRITRAIMDAAPGRVALPGDVSLSSCNGWDPAALATQIKKDVYLDWYKFAQRDLEAYQAFLALDNCRLVKVYNYWNEHFYQENKETVRQAINDESTFLDPGFANLRDSLNQRFTSLNLN